MKGVIFNLLEEIVRQEFGEATWDQLLEATRLEGIYTSLGSYPDAELMALVGAASVALRLPPDDIVHWFGRKALPILAERYPIFFEPHRDTRSFLLTLNDIIHPEVRKVYPGADVPDFTYETASPQQLTMIYQSPRKLCSLAEGLIQGAAAHYAEEVRFTQSECMKQGQPRCVFQLTFDRHKSAPHG